MKTSLRKRLGELETGERKKLEEQLSWLWGIFTVEELEMLLFEPSTSELPEFMRAKECFDQLNGKSLIERALSLERSPEIVLDGLAIRLMGEAVDPKILKACGNVIWIAGALDDGLILWEPGEFPTLKAGPAAGDRGDVVTFCGTINRSVVEADPPLPTGGRTGFEWCKQMIEHLRMVARQIKNENDYLNH